MEYQKENIEAEWICLRMQQIIKNPQMDAIII